MKAITNMTTTVKSSTVEIHLWYEVFVPEGFIKDIRDVLMHGYAERRVICNYDLSKHVLCISIPFDPDLICVVTHAIDYFKQFENVINGLCAIAKDINGGE